MSKPQAASTRNGPTKSWLASKLTPAKAAKAPKVKVIAAPDDPKELTAAELRAELENLELAYRDTIAAQVAAEKNGPAPDKLLASRFRLEEMLISKRRECELKDIAEAQAKFEADKEAWFDLQKQRAELIVGLRRVNAAIEKKRSAYRSGGAYPVLPLYASTAGAWSHYLLGHADAHGVTGRSAIGFLQACIKAKIIDERDFRYD